MNFSDETTVNVGLLPNASPNGGAPHPRGTRSIGRILLLVVAFLAGILVTLVGLFSYVFFFASSGSVQPVVSSPSGGTAAIVVQTRTAFMTAVTRKNLNVPGLPGQVQNAQISFTHNGPMRITADVQLNILGITTTRQMILDLQPGISSCKLHFTIVNADLQGFPLTAIMQPFEGQINSQMQSQSSGLPPGFNYCVINVQTDPEGLTLTYSATPI